MAERHATRSTSPDRRWHRYAPRRPQPHPVRKIPLLPHQHGANGIHGVDLLFAVVLGDGWSGTPFILPLKWLAPALSPGHGRRLDDLRHLAAIMYNSTMELPSEKDRPFLRGGLIYGLILLPFG